ncbi:hypothetical protein D3C72_2302300 [compost metagenome]
MRHMARPRIDLQLRIALAHPVDQLQAVVHAVDRHHQDARAGDAGSFEQVQPRGIAIENLEAVLAQELDLVRIVVEHRDADALAVQHPPVDLSEAA